jgi:hypothetical protein
VRFELLLLHQLIYKPLFLTPFYLIYYYYSTNKGSVKFLMVLGLKDADFIENKHPYEYFNKD